MQGDAARKADKLRIRGGDLRRGACATMLDYRLSQGIYVSDPDGNLLELYVDADPSVWHQDSSVVAYSEALALGDQIRYERKR
jgi:catechol-2,3-dioxygenase